jgi:outer membrane receptor protein involved in Fe transport
LFNPLVNVYTAQDLSNTPLVRAPDWGLSFGAEYEFELGRGYRLALTNNNQYSSRYVTFPAIGRPNDDNYQPAFVKVDLAASLRAPSNRWELALIGKNITDKLTTGGCTPANQAQGTVVPNPSGGTVRGPAGFDEVSCNINPGREVWLRLTLRPFGSR